MNWVDYPREAWSARIPQYALQNVGLHPRFLVIHHTALNHVGGTQAKLEMQSIFRLHTEKFGWEDIGYHFLIDADGKIWEGRPLQIRGAHCKLGNFSSLGICLMGNFAPNDAGYTGPPSLPQQESLIQLIRKLQRYYSISDGNLFTHQYWANKMQLRFTLCPGRDVISILKENFSNGNF